MGIIKKQSIYSTVYTYLGVLLGFVTTGILFPRYLSTDENGVLKLLVSYSTIFAQLASLGFNNVTLKYFPFFRDKASKHKGFMTLLVSVIIVGSLLFLGLFFLIKPWIIEQNSDKAYLFNQYITLVLPITLFTLLFNGLDMFFRSSYQSTRGALMKELIQRILIISALCGFIFFNLTFDQFVLWYAVALMVPAWAMLLLLIRDGELTLSTEWPPIPKPMAREMVSVSAFGLLTGFSALAIANIDSIMISQLSGTAFTGVYAITSYFGVLVAIPSRSFMRIGGTVIADGFKNNDLETIGTIYRKSCMTQFIIGTLLFIGIWVNIDQVLLMLPPDYAHGKYVIFFIGLANLMIMLGGANSIIISNSPYFRYNGYFVAGLVLVAVITNYIFIPIWSIKGAAFASFISLFLFNLLKFLLIYRKFRLQPYTLRYLLIILLAVIAYGLGWMLPSLGRFYLDIALQSIVVAVTFLSPIYLLNISTDITQLINQVLQRIGLR